jgi:hypothetical protein
LGKVMSFFSRFRRAVGASLDTLGVQRFRARGEVIRCPVCGGSEFVRSSGSPYVKPIFRWLSVPWLELDRYATSLICAHCTHMLIFGRAPEPFEDVE